MSDLFVSALHYTAGVVVFLFSFRLLTLNPQNQNYRLLFYLMFTIDVCFFMDALSVYRPELAAGFADEVTMTARILRRPLLLHLTLVFFGDPRIKTVIAKPLIYLPACFALLLIQSDSTSVKLWLHGGETFGGAIELYPIILVETLLLLYIFIAALVFLKRLKYVSTAATEADIIVAAGTILVSALSGPFITTCRLLKDQVSFAGLADHFLFVPAAVLLWVFYKTYVKESHSYETAPKRIELINRGYTHLVYGSISCLFLLGAAFSFAYDFYILNYSSPKSPTVLIYSVAAACIIGLIEKTNIKEDVKDFTPPLLMTGFILMMIFNHGVENIFPLLFLAVLLMLLFVLLNNRIAIISIGLTTLISGALFALKFYDAGCITVGAVDYITVLPLFLAISVISLIINKLFVLRMNENQNQILLQDIVTNIALSFTNVYAADLNNNINKILNAAGSSSAIERAVIWLVDSSGVNARLTHEWYQDGEIPAKPVFPPIYIPDFMAFYNTLSRNETLELSSDFFEGYYKEDEINPFTYLQAHSVLCIPLTSDSSSKKLLIDIADGKLDSIENRYSSRDLKSDSEQGVSLAGFIGLTSKQKRMKWSKNHKYLLRILSSTIMHICSRANSERAVFSMAYFDQLTGLPNRFFLAEELGKKLDAASQKGGLVGVALVDLDFFKFINDAVGHNIGDDVLCTVSERFSKSIAEHDTVVRFGGDEFIVIFDDANDKDDIIKRTERLLKTLEEPVTAGGQSFFITASAGIAVYPYDGEDADTLIKNADMTMYVSKDEGKNRFHICTEQIKENILSELFLINNLNFALEKEQFFLNYQPFVRISDGSISGFEVLCRWDLPGTGLVPPDKFIRLAEKSSLINQIGDYVLYTSCRQTKEWQDMGLAKIPVSVNFSMRQFQNINLVAALSEILQRSGLSPEYLVMEVTESIESSNTNQVNTMLKEFNKLGIAIALDDFGMQYSSLNRLKTMPFSKLKIDMQFIRGITVSEKDQGVAKTIIQLAKNLNLTVVAEGVETAEQLELLREWGCDEVQGYYFYKPMSAAEFEEVLRKDLRSTGGTYTDNSQIR